MFLGYLVTVTIIYSVQRSIAHFSTRMFDDSDMYYDPQIFDGLESYSVDGLNITIIP